MNTENELDLVLGRQGSGMGALRIALLFGSAAVALALIAVPLLEGRSPDRLASGIDLMSTGSIGRGEIYTIRRSVLQPSPDAVCVIRADGARSGDC
jgi:hypothetical protein